MPALKRPAPLLIEQRDNGACITSGRLHLYIFSVWPIVTATASALITLDGHFTLTFPQELAAGVDYYLDTYVDMNGDLACTPPPADHSWRTKIEGVTGDISRSVTHHMGLENVCPSFATGATEAPTGITAAITGTLTLADGVSANNGLSPGQALSGATIFLQGFPGQETRTNTAGAFTLDLILPLALTNPLTNRRLIMWYTVPGDASDPQKWTPSAARFGTTKDLTLESGATVAIGTAALNYTKGMVLQVHNRDTGVPINGCWINIPTLGFQLWVLKKGEGEYLIDYLPPQDYEIVLHCTDFKDQTITRTISPATAAGQQETMELVNMVPL